MADDWEYERPRGAPDPVGPALDLFFRAVMRALEDLMLLPLQPGQHNRPRPTVEGALKVVREVAQGHGIPAAGKYPLPRLTRAERAQLDGRYDPRR